MAADQPQERESQGWWRRFLEYIRRPDSPLATPPLLRWAMPRDPDEQNGEGDDA